MRGALGIGLEVERLAHDQSDHAAFVEQPVAAEHAPCLHAAEPFEHFRQAVGEPGHGQAFSSAAWWTR